MTHKALTEAIQMADEIQDEADRLRKAKTEFDREFKLKMSALNLKLQKLTMALVVARDTQKMEKVA